jgi:hypothetical protein
VVNELIVSLGDVRFALRSDSRLPPLPEAYAPFVQDDPGPRPHAQFDVLPSSAALTCEKRRCTCHLVWDCPTWKLTHCSDGYYCIHLKTEPDSRVVTVGRVSSDFSTGSLVGRSGRRAAPAPYALNYPTDQVVIVNRLALANAGILHCCGIGIDGKAYLFAGPSGVGKTTIARLWRNHGARLMNDDRMLVRKMAQGLIASATPWHGDEKEIHPEPLPLGGVFFLEQAPTNEVLPLSAAQAIARFMANAVAPFYLKSAVENIADLWTEVVEKVPVNVLRCTPDDRALACVRGSIAAG